MALNTVSSDRLSTNVKTSNLGTELKKKVGQNKNIIINGAMQVAQRGTSATGLAANGYATVDRFQATQSGTDEYIEQHQVDVASGTTPYTLGFRKAFQVKNGNQTSGAGAGDFIRVLYQIEAQDIANSGWNYKSSVSYITLSFWVKASVAQTYYVNLRAYDGSQKMYCFSVALSADTWTKVTKTIPGHADLAFDNNVDEGMYIQWFQFRGTNNTGTVTLDQWNNYDASILTPDQTSTWYTTNDATYEITGVQLEVGSVATDFEHRSFGQELALCQRYFFRTPAFGTGATSIYLASGVETGTSSRIAFIMPQVMRAAPTVTAGDLNSDDEQSTTDASTVSAIVAGSSNCDRMRIQLTGGSYNAGNAVSLVCANANGFLAGDAEL